MKTHSSAVIPKKISDLSDAAWTFLINNEIPEYEIKAAFCEVSEPSHDNLHSGSISNKSMLEFFKKYDALFSEDFKTGANKSPQKPQIISDLERKSLKTPNLNDEKNARLRELHKQNSNPADEEV